MSDERLKCSVSEHSPRVHASNLVLLRPHVHVASSLDGPRTIAGLPPLQPRDERNKSQATSDTSCSTFAVRDFLAIMALATDLFILFLFLLG